MRNLGLESFSFSGSIVQLVSAIYRRSGHYYTIAATQVGDWNFQLASNNKLSINNEERRSKCRVEMVVTIINLYRYSYRQYRWYNLDGK